MRLAIGAEPAGELAPVSPAGAGGSARFTCRSGGHAARVVAHQSRSPVWAEGMEGGRVSGVIAPRTAGADPRGPPADPPRGGKAAPPPGPLAGCQGVLSPVSVEPDSDAVLERQPIV